MIYRAALVFHRSIDLWPHKYVQNPQLVAARIETYRDKFGAGASLPTYRQQDDLQYVRQQMATGMLVVCRQIHREAALIFWQDNTFRFSGDFDWLGLRRFLATIGRQAISYLRTLEAFIPLDSIPLKPNGQPNRVEYYWAYEAKNTPKLQMAKVYEKERDWRTTIAEVCFLLARSPPDLHLILPGGPYLDEEELDWLSSLVEVVAQLQYSLKISAIIEPGGILEGVQTPQLLADIGIDVFCMPGSVWIRNGTSTRNLEMKTFTDEKYGYLGGVAGLFREEERISTHARGGRTTTSPGYRILRVLKGFGGCKFTASYYYSCGVCKRGRQFRQVPTMPTIKI